MTDEQVAGYEAQQATSMQPKGYTLETSQVRTRIPFLLKHQLREYQHIGLDWLVTLHDKRLNGILADEMGLGKTIQTIALLAYLAVEKGVWGPHLIVVPTSIIVNWEMEIKRWCPGFRVLTYYGSQKERKQKRVGWSKLNTFNVCITSYKLVVQDQFAFKRKQWYYMVLDEAQHIKNFQSQRWQVLLGFKTKRRLLLTGTPLQNDIMELWSLLHFLMPQLFKSHDDFQAWFSSPFNESMANNKEFNLSVIERLQNIIRPFLLRRMKKDVETQLPDKTEHIVFCNLSRRQQYLYDEFIERRGYNFNGDYVGLMNILMQLRKVCNHPDLFQLRDVESPFTMEPLMFSIIPLIVIEHYKQQVAKEWFDVVGNEYYSLIDYEAVQQIRFQVRLDEIIRQTQGIKGFFMDYVPRISIYKPYSIQFKPSQFHEQFKGVTNLPYIDIYKIMQQKQFQGNFTNKLQFFKNLDVKNNNRLDFKPVYG